MALKKDYPEAFAKLRDAQKMIEKAVVGGLLADIGGTVHHYPGKGGKQIYYWRLYGHDSNNAREACRRFRALVPEGVRVLWEEGKGAHEALLSVETGDGRLTAKTSAKNGTAKYAEG